MSMELAIESSLNQLRSSVAVVSVLSFEEVQEGQERLIQFEVRMDTPFSSSLKAHRGIATIDELHSSLSIDSCLSQYLPSPPSWTGGVSENALKIQSLELQHYLNQLAKISACWSNSCFLIFFNVKAELSVDEKFLGIFSHVASLNRQISDLSTQLKASTSALSEATLQIQNLDNRVVALEGLKSQPKVRGGSFSDNTTALRDSLSSNSGVTAVERYTNSPLLPALFGVIKPKQRFSYVSTTSDLESTPSNSACIDEGELPSSPAGDKRAVGTPLLSMPEQRQFRRPSQPRSSYFSLAGDVLYEPESGNSMLLDAFDSYATQEEPTLFDDRVDDILVTVLPQQTQLELRLNVRNFVAKEISQAIGLEVIDIGQYRLRCFLPDEPIQLGILPSDNMDASWVQALCSSLSRLTERDGGHNKTVEDWHSFNVSNLVSLPDSSPLLSTSQDMQPAQPVSKIQFSVGSISVEISIVSKVDLCMVALHEELDQLVGRDHLFKRSIVLIKSWWSYESAAILGHPFVSDRWLLCSLTCYIFNKYHKRIFQPLHALILFFTEFSYFDWKNKALSLFGPVTKSAVLSAGGVVNPESSSDSLISTDILDKYSKLAENFAALEGYSGAGSDVLIRTENTGTIIVQHPLLRGVNLVPGSQHDPENSVFVIGLRSGVHLLADMISCKIDGFKAKDTTDAVDHFFVGIITRFGCRNRRDPLDRMPSTDKNEAFLERSWYGGTSSERPASTETLKFDPEFMNRNLTSGWILGFATDSPSSLADLDKIPNGNKSFFGGDTTSDDSKIGRNETFDGLLSGGKSSLLRETGLHVDTMHRQDDRYSQKSSGGSNVDISPGLSKVRSPHGASSALFGQSSSPSHISPGNQAQISEMLLKTLALDILSTKGPLPVGEIGKMLQEVIKIPSLSSILREYFGGLKRFLEKYSDDFLISHDHPFNPNVYIRSILSAEDLAVIAKGRMPLHFELAYKKKGGNKKKNNRGLNQHGLSGQLQSGDELQAQLTRYFSSLPLSSGANANGAIQDRSDNWVGSDSFSRGWESLVRMEAADKSMRRKSYPHTDGGSSMYLKTQLGGPDEMTSEARLSDSLLSLNNRGYSSALLNDVDSGRWNRPMAMSADIGDHDDNTRGYYRSLVGNDTWGVKKHLAADSASYGQPNPRAPEFVPNRGRFNS